MGADAEFDAEFDERLRELRESSSAGLQADERFLVFGELGVLLASRYAAQGDAADLDDAISALRVAGDASAPPDVEPAWIRMELARLLVIRGEIAENVDDIEAAIEYLRGGLAELTPPDDPDPDFALAFHDLGLACSLRAVYAPSGAVDDFRMSADAFRRSIALSPVSHPALGETTARLGVVLAAAIVQEMGGLDDHSSVRETGWAELDGRVTDALRTLESGWRDLASDDSYRPVVQYWRAMMRMARFTLFGGASEDRQRALADFTSYLEAPGRDDRVADFCHVLIAFLQLCGTTPAAFKTRVTAPSLANFARFLAAEQMADPEAARIALGHLDQITDVAAVSTAYGGLLPALRLAAAAALDGGNATEDHLGTLLADLGQSTEEPAGDEFGVLIDWLRQLQTLRDGSATPAEVAEAFTRFVDGLDDTHPMRPALKALVGQLLDGFSKDPAVSRPASREERDAAFELLEQVLLELPDDHPNRGPTLVRLTNTLIRGTQDDYSAERLTRVRGLLLDALERPTKDVESEVSCRLLLILVECLLSLAEGTELRPLGDTIESLKRVITLIPPERPMRAMIPLLLGVVLSQHFRLRGDLEYMDAAAYYIGALSQAVKAGDVPAVESAVTLDWLLASMPLLREQSVPDRHVLDKVIGSMEELLAGSPEEPDLRSMLERNLRAFEYLRLFLVPGGVGFQRPNLAHLAEATKAVVDRADEVDPTDPLYALEIGAAGYVTVGTGHAGRDLKTIDEGLALAADACQAGREMPAFRPRLLSMFGYGLTLRYEVTRDRADLSNAIQKLEEARRAAEDGVDDLTGDITHSLAGAYHIRGDERLGDRRRAGEAGLDSLRARAWAVMLQTSTGRAFDAAAVAAGEAQRLALWCVSDGLIETAIEVLERGRAMVLHVATTETGLPGLLREAGHHDLAAEWEASAAENGPAPWDSAATTGQSPVDYARLLAGLSETRLPGDLRRRVIAAIRGTEIERRLFSPPAVEEISGALRAAGAAALVYLVAAEQQGAGLALVVGADGQVRQVELRRLRILPGSRVAAFAEAQRDREGLKPESDQARHAQRVWADALAQLCDWAWTAAMAPLLDVLADASDQPGLPVRLVLVPVGDLAVVPWHAARRTVADGTLRYACQDAVISYAASARQFIDARRYERRPWNQDPAVVRVAGLYWAAKEAEHIHGRHYPDGRLLGGRPGAGGGHSLPATAGNVRDLLPGPRSPGATLLHLGCHAWASPRPADSRLLLAGNEILGMTDILRQARARPPGVCGGLVVLAACGSDLTSRHHDEALTLATAFLAAGAVGVIGTRWPVVDLPTSMLMSMFHHYLNAGYDDPAVALRAAQLWMLDPRRSAPAALPARLIELMGTVALHEPESWAAFTYQGR
ncbi:CHAT domain-containing protein [Streptosporangiaceae bacterium NEAU-GS5]|nr:CHAT domain-containing protein [Streptosporangiaceae bacterium NEAU-GS5]